MAGLMRRMLLAGIGLACGAGILAEAGVLAVAARSARVAARERAQRQAAWRKLAAAHPNVTEAGAAAAAADRRRAEAALAEAWRACHRWRGFAPPGGRGADVPRTGVDAFLALAGFVRRMRTEADNAGVVVRPDEQFGFGAYAHEGPPAELAAAVEHQRRMLEPLLEILWAAKPQQLDALQRARSLPRPPPARPDRNEPRRARSTEEAAGGDRGGLFEMDPQLSLAVRGLIESETFRLTFVGDTAALRRLLNGAVAANCPLIVREIAVEPVKEPSPRDAKAAGGSGSPALILRPGRSRFTIVVEACDLVGAPPPVEAADARLAAEPRTVGVWPDAVPQRKGPGWVFDLFTPPSLYYDPRSGALKAAATTARTDAADQFELDLLAVERAPFRWQLAGYASGTDGLRGIFADADSGDTIVAGKGDRLGDLGWTVQNLALDHLGVGSGGDTTLDPVTVAVVADETGDVRLTLTSRGPCLAGPPLGTFTSRADPAFRCRLREGQSVTLHDADYFVERLDLQIPRALVARVAAGDGQPTRRALTPRTPEPASSGRPDLMAPASSPATVSLAP